MAWEWVAPTATFATGVAGMWFTYKTSRRQSESQFNVLIEQLKASRLSDLIKAKRELFSNYLGALSEASYITTFTKATHLVLESTLDEMNSDIRDRISAEIRDTSPKETPPESIAEMVDDKMKKVLSKLRIQAKEDLLARYGTHTHPLWAVDLNRLYSLRAQVDMICEDKVKSLTIEPIQSIINAIATKEASKLYPASAEIETLRRAMQEELQYSAKSSQQGEAITNPRKRDVNNS